ncbi:MAG: SpoIID/LytB domain-containing protein [Ignavibacteriales bacterium]|nr:SpoIID/LytB domain-containing protein [Ignavibacteriales bacterium]
MISQEPIIKVGIFEGRNEVRGTFKGKFRITDSMVLDGDFVARAQADKITLVSHKDNKAIELPEVFCKALASHGASFVLKDVTIGVQFHWQRNEDQTFEGNLRFLPATDGTITAINEIGLEDYLKSVISSEMSAEAPIELLKAHAITSRSWLVAMLEREKKAKQHGMPAQRSFQKQNELIRWYDREDHLLFDVCADDHCQRYQGVTKIISHGADEAVKLTRGMFLVYHDEICDARFYKACGGLTEKFENAWEDASVPYLQVVSDSPIRYPEIHSESEAERWIRSTPDAYCSTTDGKILHQVLPSFDQETTDFFRWTVKYEREELENIIASKSGFDFGTIKNLVPIQRGPSGRIVKLKIEGSKKTMVVGKELEVRRWLSKSHLYSSAFVVDVDRDANGIPKHFVLRGAGWGHGVGLCQIGAAVMATKGIQAEEIVKHYFVNSKLRQIYK